MLQPELDRPGKLMVSGIPKRKDYGNSELEKHFSAFGRVAEVYVVRDRNAIPKGFAFVTFEKPQDSLKAIKAMEGKDLGGESKVHCEQARIGMKQTMIMKGQLPGNKGGGGNDRGRGRGNEPNSGRGFPRGRGMMDRGRGLMDRGRGLLDRGRGLMDWGRGPMGRGMMGRGLLGMPPMGRGLFDEGGFDYPEEEFYEEFYDQEPPYMGFPPPGGPGGLSLRGALQGRGRPSNQNTSARAGKGLLPDPLVRGGRIGPYPGQMRGQPAEDLYGEDANEAGYYDELGNPYAEARDESYPEVEDYPSEEYYEQEWRAPPQPRGRGALTARGRGLLPRAAADTRASRQQMEDYDYETESATPQRSRAPASAARLGRGTPARRGGASSARRAGPLLEADPYADEDGSMYDRVSAAALKAGAHAVPDYGDDSYADPYGQRVAAGASRQAAAARSRAAVSSEAMYPGDRSHPKPLLDAAMMSAAISALGPNSARVDEDDDDDYQSQGVMAAQARAAYSEGRRPPVRSDPYSRKRPIDPYDDPEAAGHAMSAIRQDYEDLRSAAIIAAKRDRADRAGDRGGYDPYGRQEGMYRGL
ncbi:hypothetical protein BsWGS_03902 [Bradybaena similaris]